MHQCCSDCVNVGRWSLACSGHYSCASRQWAACSAH